MRGKMDKVAVLIPCYNEEKTIYKVVTDARKALPEAVVYVYDNNSTDKTIEEATRAGAVVRHEYMQGKGNVIRRMFREIQAECYVMVDGDDTYPMECAPEMASMVLNLISGQGVTLPVYLDVEASGGRADGIGKDMRTRVCKAFCQTIQNSGYKAGAVSYTHLTLPTICSV